MKETFHCNETKNVRIHHSFKQLKQKCTSTQRYPLQICLKPDFGKLRASWMKYAAISWNIKDALSCMLLLVLGTFLSVLLISSIYNFSSGGSSKKGQIKQQETSYCDSTPKLWDFVSWVLLVGVIPLNTFYKWTNLHFDPPPPLVSKTLWILNDRLVDTFLVLICSNIQF